MKVNLKKWSLRIGLILAGTVLAILILAVVFLQFFLASAVRHGIENFGSRVAGVPITLEDLQIKPLRGIVMLKGLKIGNVKGYSNQYIMTLDHFYINLDMKTLSQDKIRIEEVQIKGVRVNFETNLLSNNMNDLQKQINKNLEQADSGKEPAKKAEVQKAEDPQKPLKYQIDSLELSNISVALSVKETSTGIPLTAPPFNLQNLGTSPEGITGAEVCTAILQKLTVECVNLLATGTVDVGDVLNNTTVKGINAVKKDAVKGIEILKGFLGKE